MRLPRNISPAAARRRTLLADLAAAVAIALATIFLCAGLGIVAVAALVTLFVMLPWTAIEALVRRNRGRRRRSGADRPTTAARPSGPRPARAGSSATNTGDDAAPSVSGRR